jgi:hypothetical protein
MCVELLELQEEKKIVNKKKSVENKCFYDVMPYALVDRYHCSTGTCCMYSS